MQQAGQRLRLRRSQLGPCGRFPLLDEQRDQAAAVTAGRADEVDVDIDFRLGIEATDRRPNSTSGSSWFSISVSLPMVVVRGRSPQALGLTGDGLGLVGQVAVSGGGYWLS
jgi:hypothetical protein